MNLTFSRRFLTSCTRLARSFIVLAFILFSFLPISVGEAARAAPIDDIALDVNLLQFLFSTVYYSSTGSGAGVVSSLRVHDDQLSDVLAALNRLNSGSGSDQSWTNDLIRSLQSPSWMLWTNDLIRLLSSNVSALSGITNDLHDTSYYVSRVYSTDAYGQPAFNVTDVMTHDLLSQIQSDTGNYIPGILSDVVRAIYASGADISGNLHDTTNALTTLIRGDEVYQSIVTNQLIGPASMALLEGELTDAGFDTTDFTPTNTPMPEYVDPFDVASGGIDSLAESAASSGGSLLQNRLTTLSGMLEGNSDSEIVVIPEFMVGGIHVREYRARLDGPLTSAVHGVMFFLYYVALFAGLWSLGQSEFAFYANLGRNWHVSKGMPIQDS